MSPHAYMYSKKLDERDLEKPLPSHSKKMREPPPQHEFVYRWFRGPPQEHCGYEGCPRRTSFSPHDWSLYALGTRHGIGSSPKKAAACRLQCVSSQSSLHMCTFCNSSCFVQAWKTQYTIPKGSNGGYGGGGYNNSRSNTPTPYVGGGTPMRSPSFDETQSVGSNGSGTDTGLPPARMNSQGTRSPVPPGTPRVHSGSYNSNGNAISSYNANNDYGDEEWLEVSRDQIFIPGPDDVGRKLKLEASAYSLESGERLMFRVVKTDLVLARAPDPVTRTLVVANGNGGMKAGQNTTITTQTTAANLHGNPYSNPGPRFRVVTYNVLAEIYATQQQYPYCDFWALSWDYRYVL